MLLDGIPGITAHQITNTATSVLASDWVVLYRGNVAYRIAGSDLPSGSVYTDADARAAMSGDAANGLIYNSSTGAFSVVVATLLGQGDTDSLPEGSTNKYWDNDAGNAVIINVGAPSALHHAANRQYVDDQIAGNVFVARSGPFAVDTSDVLAWNTTALEFVPGQPNKHIVPLAMWGSYIPDASPVAYTSANQIRVRYDGGGTNYIASFSNGFLTGTTATTETATLTGQNTVIDDAGLQLLVDTADPTAGNGTFQFYCLYTTSDTV